MPKRTYNNHTNNQCQFYLILKAMIHLVRKTASAKEIRFIITFNYYGLVTNLIN